jgi:1-deoxy-D-xylulose-5-phosphate reductoisomerase
MAGMVVAPSLDAPRSISILGSTGSVGCNTVALVQANPDRFRVQSLVAGRNVALLAEQARAVRAQFAVVADESGYTALREALSGSGIACAAGPAAVLEAAARPAEWVMAAIVGAAGLEPTLTAIRRGAMIGLANKEALVCAGELVMQEVRRSGAVLLPVDSEHSAIFQVLDSEQTAAVRRLILTASGGPFRDWSREQMAAVSPEQACAHPNWSMGAKISVDSATMMNKGLEIIEAHHLFAMPSAQIDVVVHPQSVVHSLVEYVDGSVLAQLGTPDMRTPIAVALAWPGRMATPGDRLDLFKTGRLDFSAPDTERFPALALARQALESGGAAPTILNAANEVAVAGFLSGAVSFLDIERVVAETLGSLRPADPATLSDIVAVDAESRRIARAMIDRRNGCSTSSEASTSATVAMSAD